MHASLLVRTHEAPGVGADQGSGLFFFLSVVFRVGPRKWRIRPCSVWPIISIDRECKIMRSLAVVHPHL